MEQVNKITFNGLTKIVEPVSVPSFDDLVKELDDRFYRDDQITRIDYDHFENGLRAIVLRDSKNSVIVSYKSIQSTAGNQTVIN